MANPDSFLNHLRANAYLAYRATLYHPFKKLFSRDTRSGMEKFLDNYGSEGLLPTPEEDRRVLRGASRCIHCGLCDAVDSDWSAHAHRGYGGMSQLPVAFTRASADAPWALAAAERFDDETLARGEAVCPTRVPLRELAAYLRRKAKDVSKALGQ